jgi:hypothetical protein
VASRHVLGPLEARIYRTCDVATSSAAVVATLERTGEAVAPAQVEDILAGFAERKLVHAFGNRIVALALETPMAPYSDPMDFPAGLLLPPRVAAAAAKRSPRQPESAWDVPVRSLPQFVTLNHRSATT